MYLCAQLNLKIIPQAQIQDVYLPLMLQCAQRLRACFSTCVIVRA